MYEAKLVAVFCHLCAAFGQPNLPIIAEQLQSF